MPIKKFATETARSMRRSERLTKELGLEETKSNESTPKNFVRTSTKFANNTIKKDNNFNPLK